MLMTAMEKVTNHIVTINNGSRARQSGETPSWRSWCYWGGGSRSTLRYGIRNNADANVEKGTPHFAFFCFGGPDVLGSLPRNNRLRRCKYCGVLASK